MQPILEKIYQKNNKWSTKDLIWEFGKHIEKEKNREEEHKKGKSPEGPNLSSNSMSSGWIIRSTSSPALPPLL